MGDTAISSMCSSGNWQKISREVDYAGICGRHFSVHAIGGEEEGPILFSYVEPGTDPDHPHGKCSVKADYIAIVTTKKEGPHPTLCAEINDSFVDLMIGGVLGEEGEGVEEGKVGYKCHFDGGGNTIKSSLYPDTFSQNNSTGEANLYEGFSYTGNCYGDMEGPYKVGIERDDHDHCIGGTDI